MSERGPRPMMERQEAPKPLESAREQEGASEELETREYLAEAVQEKEKSLVQDVRRGVAEWLEAAKVMRKLPIWVRLGILSTRLFATETAVAKEMADEPVSEFTVERPRPALPELSEGEKDRARLQLEPYFGEWDYRVNEETVTVSHVIYVNYTSGEEVVTAEQLMTDGGVVVGNSLESLSFHRQLEAVQMPQEESKSWHVSTGEKQVTAMADVTDKFGNHLRVFRFYNKETAECSEVVNVEPVIAFARPGQEPQMQSMMIDLSMIGGSEIRNAFYYEELPAVELVDGNEVYFTGLDQEKVRAILAEYGDDLSRGAEHVDALFGYHQGSSIILREDAEANAAYQDWGRVIVNSGLFELPDQANISREQIIEEVMEHEQFHYRDAQYNFSTDEELVSVFASARPEVLNELNEYVFSEGFGGHAQDNEKEFVASVLNSLDAAAWEDRVTALTPRARALYGDALLVIDRRVDVFQARYRQDTEPPISSLLQERLAFLERASTVPAERND